MSFIICISHGKCFKARRNLRRGCVLIVLNGVPHPAVTPTTGADSLSVITPHRPAGQEGDTYIWERGSLKAANLRGSSATFTLKQLRGAGQWTDAFTRDVLTGYLYSQTRPVSAGLEVAPSMVYDSVSCDEV